MKYSGTEVWIVRNATVTRSLPLSENNDCLYKLCRYIFDILDCNLFQIATGRSLGIHSQVCNAFLVKCLCFYFGKFKNKDIFGAHLNNLHLKHCMVISFILDCPESSFEFFLNGFSCNTLGKNLNKLFVQPNTSIILFSMNWRYFNKIWN